MGFSASMIVIVVAVRICIMIMVIIFAMLIAVIIVIFAIFMRSAIMSRLSAVAVGGDFGGFNLS